MLRNTDEFTPNGAKSTFASVLDPKDLAFNSAENLFESDYHSGDIYEFTPNGIQSTFATNFNQPVGVAIQPVPEPATWALLATGASALLFRYRRKACQQF
jgi:hypothetical protein